LPPAPQKTPSPRRQSPLELTVPTPRGARTETPRKSATPYKTAQNPHKIRHKCSSARSRQNARYSSRHIRRVLPPKAGADSRTRMCAPLRTTQTRSPLCATAKSLPWRLLVLVFLPDSNTQALSVRDTSAKSQCRARSRNLTACNGGQLNGPPPLALSATSCSFLLPSQKAV
jgi:hypothetical protein